MNSLKISGFNINSKKKVVISGSKSESNRVLILKYLFNTDIIIDNLSNSDDTKVLLKALENQTDIVDIHHAGTAMRFLTSLFAVIVSVVSNTILFPAINSKEDPCGIGTFFIK